MMLLLLLVLLLNVPTARAQTMMLDCSKAPGCLNINGQLFPAAVAPGCVYLVGCPCYVFRSNNRLVGACDRVNCTNLFCGPPAPIFSFAPTTTTTTAMGLTDNGVTLSTTASAPLPTTTTALPETTLPEPTTGNNGAGTKPACQLLLGCECLFGDRCAERLRCENNVCVDDPNALVPDADDWERTIVKAAMRDCGCAVSGRAGRAKIEIVTKDALGRTVNVVGDPEFSVLLTNERTGNKFEPLRRRRALGYINGTATAFLQFDDAAPYTVAIVATHGGAMRELDKFPVTACAAGSKVGETADCACVKASVGDAGTCAAPLKCNATLNQCVGAKQALVPPETGLSTGVIIGISIGALCALLMLLVVLFIAMRVAQARADQRFELERQQAMRSEAMMAGTSQAYRDMLAPSAGGDAVPTIVLPASVANLNTEIPLPPRPAPSRALPTSPKTYGNVSDVVAPKTYASTSAAAAAAAPKTYGSTSAALQAGAAASYYGDTAGTYGSLSRVLTTQEQYSSTTMALAAALPPRPMPGGGTLLIPGAPRKALPPRPNLPPPPPQPPSLDQ